MSMTASRTRLMVDLKPETVQTIKIKAVTQGKSMRALILEALAAQYPDMAEQVDAELKRQ